MYDFQYTDQLLTAFSVLRRTWLAVDKLLDTELARVGLTFDKLCVLWTCEQPVIFPVNLTSISRTLSLSKPTIADLLGRMEREGLIEKERRKGSQPFTEVRITGKGTDSAELGRAKLKGVLQNIMSDFSIEEQKQLSDISQKMLANTLKCLNIDLTPPPGVSPAGEIIPNW